ncbi:hypothetical protein [Streptomyces sp. NPDC058307]|uniref:hypothetical protein n=1 Tax=Streptomyces sp. NPDC058307 TaxID=3346439 RepID=UPI0036EE74F5
MNGKAHIDPSPDCFIAPCAERGRRRGVRERLDLPERFRLHDWRHDKVTNDLDAGENPLKVFAA